MADPSHLSFAPISEIGEQIRNGRLSPVALAELCLDRIGALNPRLNAFITVTAELARVQARQAGDEIRCGHWRGPLHGVPVAVKDFYDTAGIRTTAGFELFENRVPTTDAEMVVRLREAGAVLVGKTNMHKLGMGTTSLDSHFGPVVNPWSATYVAGGSSGGSAVAVAAGLCYATVDTDAIGSGRLPAAICGVTCHKPSFGLLSSEGILSGEEADPAILLLAHPCVTARTAEDVRLVFNALTNVITDVTASARHPERGQSAIPRIGIVTNFAAGAEVRAAFEEAIGGLAAMRVKTSEIAVPFEKASFDVRTIEADRAMISSVLFDSIDAMVLPTLAAPTPTVAEARARGDNAVSPENTFFCNYYGLPAISVPTGVDGMGPPFGLQIVGPQGSDDFVLSLAQDYQQATDRQFTPPPGVI